ncbi:MAG: hypothetical protein UX94_C0005G0071 [Parcubacteria group bacterium GW2011_GWA2_47_21]|nr:MAG: hypothetical protein UX94_C0005G0071 [Parcubacteria group bacterium GW2011_GWA2_47_21]
MPILSLYPRYVAVKFTDDTRSRGEQIIFTQTKESVGLRHGINVLGEEDLVHLDCAGIEYARYYPKSIETREIYEFFGV